jgi:hypothetical protein
MMAHYAYLVVKRGRVALDQPSEKPVPSEKSVSSQEAPIAATSGDFPDRVRNTLDAAAKSVGYGTLERLMGSTRTLGRPTPSRAAQVRRLVEAGLVSEDESVSKMVGGAVPDAAVALQRQPRFRALSSAAWSANCSSSASEPPLCPKVTICDRTPLLAW